MRRNGRAAGKHQVADLEEPRVPIYSSIGGAAVTSSGIGGLAESTGRQELARNADYVAGAEALASVVLLVDDLGVPGQDATGSAPWAPRSAASGRPRCDLDGRYSRAAYTPRTRSARSSYSGNGLGSPDGGRGRPHTAKPMVP